MVCGGCGFDNPAGVKFCGECGSSIEALGHADANEQLQAAQQQYKGVGSTGHAERIARELGA